MNRIAIVDRERCKPDKCARECIKRCPPQKSGKIVIEIEDLVSAPARGASREPMTKNQIAKIIESQCIGCNQCVKACPFDAIRIVNLPTLKQSELIHRYGPNCFMLYQLPAPKIRHITGIIGQNGVGKTTIIDILSGKLRPNFGMFDESAAVDDKDIIRKFRGNSLQDYLRNLYAGRLTFSVKEQQIKRTMPHKTCTVREYIEECGIGSLRSIPTMDAFYAMQLDRLMDSTISTLSGGELQRLKCWCTASVDADVYIFDEPSNFLDVKQRLEVARMIRSMDLEHKYALLIEHDLSILDYVSDEIYIVYGSPGQYGIVSTSQTPAEGINRYLSGYIPSQNMRFREEEFDMQVSADLNVVETTLATTTLTDVNYEQQTISHGDEFELTISAGSFSANGNIYLIMGQNGCGKTTFIKWFCSTNDRSCSVKEQSPKLVDTARVTVEELLYNRIQSSYINPQFKTTVVNPLEIEKIKGKVVRTLSGGELQKVCIVLCLGAAADVYLLDEPSANLDIESRLALIKVIRNFARIVQRPIFIIEHDIMVSVALAQECGSRVLLAEEMADASISCARFRKTCTISAPTACTEGINKFLRSLDITMRRSGHNRPRINTHGSRLDQEQKRVGLYYG